MLKELLMPKKAMLQASGRGRYASFEVWLSNHIKPVKSKYELRKQLEDLHEKLKEKDPATAKALRKYIDSGAYEGAPFLQRP